MRIVNCFIDLVFETFSRVPGFNNDFVFQVTAPQEHKDYYRWFIPAQTRWKDNDCYGHMNNAVYHSIYDSIINIFLIRHCGLSTDRGDSSIVGFMVSKYQITFWKVSTAIKKDMKRVVW